MLESKECSLVVRRTIAAQTHATRFRCCCFSLQKARMYGTAIHLSWTDCCLVRSSSTNLRFMSHLRIFVPTHSLTRLHCQG